MKYKICLVKRNELKDCAKILRDIYNNNVLSEGWTEKTSLNTCLFFYKQNKDLFFVAKDENDKVIGFTYSFIKPWSHGNMLMIEEISVAENYRKHGIAKALMLAVVSKAKEKYNISNVCGEAYYDKNADWIPFDWYKRIGFSKNKELFIIESEPNEITKSLERGKEK